MKDRKPFLMKNTLIVYNFIQVLISVYLFVEVSLRHILQSKIILCDMFTKFQGMNGGWLRHYSWRCQPVDFSNTVNGLRVSIEHIFSLN